MADNYKTIGMMSGTSLDGLDIASCQFHERNGAWGFELGAAETIDYSNEWIEKLSSAPNLNQKELEELHIEYGVLLGQSVKAFIKQHRLEPDLIASHGHTIFHEPEKGLTFQLGLGSEIAKVSGITVISDFRSKDVSLGGQGAPLVPIGDKYLFGEYAYCLNLGGFANISFDKLGERYAYDICPVNILLNDIAGSLGLEYDQNGEVAKSGSIDYSLLHKLNAIPYYSQQYPKSLSREWYEKNFKMIVESSEISEQDKLRTITEHIAIQICNTIKLQLVTSNAKVLSTGGGTNNLFLIERICEYCDAEIVIPDQKMIDFKEAMIFAFLGVLRMRDEPNCLKSVTGATHDSSGGVIFKGRR